MFDDGTTDTLDGSAGETLVRAEVLKRIEDSLKVEKNWRERGNMINQIFRGRLNADGTSSQNSSRYNILNANVSILQPSLFSQCPTPDIRSRSKMPMEAEDEVANILEEMCEIVLDESGTYDQFKKAVMEFLLPGRGTCRVRWNPVVEEMPAVDEGGNPVTAYEKLLDELELEHVHWENYTQEAVDDWKKVGWVAYRHIFTEQEFEKFFSNSRAWQFWKAQGRSKEIFKWTDQTVSKTGDVVQHLRRVEDELQNVIMKAVVWEYWDKSTREVVWICVDMQGQVLRIDQDPLELTGFFPSPCPMLSLTTSDALIPTPEYEIYQDLAKEIDELTSRINAVARRIKVRGAYNGSADSLIDIIDADDGKLLPVEGMDIDHDISKHLYIIPNSDLVAALQQLYASRHEAKQAMYEITGISDIVRGQTRASETLGAQKMKSGYASLRIQDRKTRIENFSRDIIRIMAEIIAKHFDPQSFMFFINKLPSPEAVYIMQTDGLRLSRIDVESDSTVSKDEQADQEAMSAMMQALSLAMQQLVPLVQQGIMPLQVAIAFLKMMAKPFKGSREVTALLDQYASTMSLGTMPQPLPEGNTDASQ